MRRTIIICTVGALLLGTLLVIPSALGKGGGPKGIEVWWYEGGPGVGPIHKAIFQTTPSGIIHEWRYEPENLALVFKPADKFSEPDEGDYEYWPFEPEHYTMVKGDLRDIFAVWHWYWLIRTVQD